MASALTRPLTRVIAACTAALFVPLIVPLAIGRVFTRDDLLAWHLPFRHVYREALRAGDSVLWTRAVLSGFFLHGEGEGGLAHPFHLALYRLLPLGPAFNLEIISNYVALFAGTGLLFLQVGLSSEAAWFGAMLFAFSGFNLFNLMHLNHIATMAHAPWVLLAAHVLLTTGDGRRRAAAFAGLAFLVGSQLLMGNPQYVWLTMVALGFLMLSLLWSGAGTSRAALVIVAVGLGVGIGAVQLLPTLEFAQASMRAAWSPDQSMSFSLAPVNLIQLFSPFAFQFRVYAPPAEASIVHEFIVYNGAFCTLALVWLAMRWRQQTRQGLLIGLLIFAGLALVLAMGRYGPAYPWLAQLPGIRNFRAPARHLVLFQLALSGVAAVVFEDVAGVVRGCEVVPWQSLWPLAIPIAISVGLTLGAGALAGSSWAASHDLLLSSVLRAGPWSGLVVAAALTLALSARGVPWALPTLIVLTAFDLGLWGYTYAYRWGPLRTIAELGESAYVPPDAQPGDLISPMTGAGPVNLPILRGLRLTSGYNGLEPASVLDPADRRTEQLAGVDWRPDGGHWVHISDSMPRARLVSDARTSTNVRSDVRTVDVLRVALIDRGLPDVSGVPGSVRILKDRPGSIVVETSAGGRQLLVLTERFHEGWRAAEDGRLLETVRVDGDFLGCLVDAGDHRVTLTFAPDSVRQGLRVSIAGVALTFAALGLMWSKRDL